MPPELKAPIHANSSRWRPLNQALNGDPVRINPGGDKHIIHLSRFPADVQVYIRRRMREVMRRDRIIADLHFKEMVRQKAAGFGGEDSPQAWHGKTEEAKKQLTNNLLGKISAPLVALQSIKLQMVEKL